MIAFNVFQKLLENNLKKQGGKAMNPGDFLEEIRNFFRMKFPDFKCVEPGEKTSRYAFYKNFIGIGLSIVIFTPLRIRGDELEFISDSKMKIDTQLRITKNKREVVVLVGTMLHGCWKTVLEKKINILADLIKDIKQCDDCGNFMTPRVFQRRNKEQTWFVSSYCWRCRKFHGTTYGICLKTRLHKYLKHQRT